MPPKHSLNTGIQTPYEYVLGVLLSQGMLTLQTAIELYIIDFNFEQNNYRWILQD